MVDEQVRSFATLIAWAVDRKGGDGGLFSGGDGHRERASAGVLACDVCVSAFADAGGLLVAQ